MPENVIKWMIEDQLIFIKIYEWDIESLKSDTLTVNSMINQSDKPLVHSIWDLRDMEKYPTNLREILKTNQILLSNEQLGWSIAIINSK